MTDHNRERILRRIKKCLALSESDNEHEAANALRQARRLMQMHGIDLEEASEPVFEVLDRSDGKRSRGGLRQAEMMLYAVVCEFFGCSIYSVHNWPVIVGESPAPEIAEYASATLLRQLRQNRQKALEQLETDVGRRLHSSHRRDFNSSYSTTWVCAISKKVEAFAQSFCDQTKAKHEQAVRKHWNMGANITQKSYRQSRRESAITQYAEQQGALDGRRAELNYGVGEGPKQAQLTN